MRIGGLVSGMDTEQMIKDMMKIEQMKVDRLFQQEQTIKWRQEAYNTVNRNLANFILNTQKSFGLKKNTSTGSLVTGSSDSFKWVKKVSSSDESALKVSGNANAMQGNHTVKIESLATEARLTSGKDINTSDFTGEFTIENNGKSHTIKFNDAQVKGGTIDLSKLDFTDGSKGPDGEEIEGGVDNSLTFTINGKTIKLDREFVDLDDLKTTLKGKDGDVDHPRLLPEGVDIKIENGALVFDSKNNISISGDKEELTVLGLEPGTTKANNDINYLVKEINNAVDADKKSLGLRAAYDKDLGLMITSKDTGSDQIIKITADSTNTFAIGATKKGTDAVIEFNGETETVTKNSNNFTVYGINLELINETSSVININVSSDVDGVYDQVKSFVEEYNKIIDDINKQLGQKFYRDYHPLSNEEKQAMNDKDIELWEEKAKSGLLKGDESLNRMLQNMRTQLYEKVEGVSGSYNHITQLGITTGNYQDGGKLVIDEEKLRAAISEDPEGVMDLLFKSPESSATGKEKMENSGLINRIYDNMIDGMKEVIKKSGPGEDSALLRDVRSNILIDFVTKQSSISLLGKDLTSLSQRIAREEILLAKREESHWAKFTAMEKAMAAMQQQSMSLMSQMGF